MTPDTSKIKRDREDIDRTLDRNQEALAAARRQSAEIERTLATSGAEARSARSDLRKVGLLEK